MCGDSLMQNDLSQEIDGGANPTSPLQMAHQKKIREERKLSDEKENLFGNFWDKIDKSLSKSVVKPVSITTAKTIIEKYEWLKCLPAIVMYSYGIYFDGVCGGCVTYGTDYCENLGVWDKYGFSGKLILLSRGACVHWTPIGSGSRLIMKSIKMLPEKYSVITATCDRLAGEFGTIYQACGWKYFGSMRVNNNLSPKREGWMINGKLFGSRAIRSKIGSQKMEDILKFYPSAVKVEQLSKDRYFYFKDKKMEYSLKHLFKPYPKRKNND